MTEISAWIDALQKGISLVGSYHVQGVEVYGKGAAESVVSGYTSVTTAKTVKFG